VRHINCIFIIAAFSILVACTSDSTDSASSLVCFEEADSTVCEAADEVEESEKEAAVCSDAECVTECKETDYGTRCVTECEGGLRCVEECEASPGVVEGDGEGEEGAECFKSCECPEDKPDEKTFCEENPEHAECKDEPAPKCENELECFCKENPEHAECNEEPAPKCETDHECFCLENPEHAECTEEPAPKYEIDHECFRLENPEHAECTEGGGTEGGGTEGGGE
jgi:hypothetical protein